MHGVFKNLNKIVKGETVKSLIPLAVSAGLRYDRDTKGFINKTRDFRITVKLHKKDIFVVLSVWGNPYNFVNNCYEREYPVTEHSLYGFLEKMIMGWEVHRMHLMKKADREVSSAIKTIAHVDK
jgi:hypothetical protein